MSEVTPPPAARDAALLRRTLIRNFDDAPERCSINRTIASQSQIKEQDFLPMITFSQPSPSVVIRKSEPEPEVGRARAVLRLRLDPQVLT